MKISINLHSEFYLVFRRSSNRLKYFVILVALMLGITIKTYSKNFYFSSSTGNDSYTAEQAQNPATPWKTIDKLNSSMSLINPGDSILFKRGEMFTGQITLTRSGIAGANIVLSAYGSGSLPVIKGTLPVTGWTCYSGNIWVADCPQLGSTVTNFFINGKSQQIGRYPNADAPNKGYLNIDSHTGSTNLTSSSLYSTQNWTGAEAVVRTRRWILDRVSIQSHSGNMLIFRNATTEEIYDNYGFFVQNHLGTLDQDGEWYFNASTNRLYLFSSSDPNLSISEITNYASNFISVNQSYLCLDNLEFSGSSLIGIDIKGGSYNEVKNCKISNSGQEGVIVTGSNYFEIVNNQIINANTNALQVLGCNNISVKFNKIANIGMRAGMGKLYHGVILHPNSSFCFFENNVLDSIGSCGIFFTGDNISIKRNLIRNFCNVLDDAAGIYTTGYDGLVEYFNRYIENNIILNGIGAGEGTDEPDYTAAEGIYLDSRTTNVFVLNNTAANCSRGIFIHNSNKISLIKNTLYNNNIQILYVDAGSVINFPINQLIVKENIFFSKLKSQLVADFRTVYNPISDFGTFDYNYYCRPFDDNLTINTKYETNSGIVSNLVDLNMWQSTYKHDLNSSKSPANISGYKIIGLLGANKIENSAFNSDTKNWNYWSSNNNGYISWQTRNDLDGGCLKLGFNRLTGISEAMSLCYGKINDILSGHHYLLKYSLIGSKQDKNVKIAIRKDGFPEDLLAPRQYIKTEQVRKDYAMLLKSESNEPNARIDFEIQEDAEAIWIDNVELFEAEIQPANINDSIKFIYNSLNTSQNFPLAGNYIDVKGTNFSGSLSLQPFTSAVLIANRDPSEPPVIPVFSGASIGNAAPAVIELTFNLTLASTVPDISAFSVMVNSAARSISSVSVSGTKVILTLASPVVNGDIVTVAYAKPSSNPLQTPEGGQAASISAQTALNGVNPVVTPPPVIVTPPPVVVTPPPVVVTPPPVVVTPPVVVPNTPPVAVVNYISGTYSGFVGELNASGSYDADMDNLIFTWKIPNNISVSATNSSVIEFLAPIVETKQIYDFTLIVSDGKTTQSKTIPVEVLPYQPGLETAEVIAVEAGDFQTPYLPYNVIDGNIGTMWSAVGNDQWIILELKDLFNIQHVKVAFQPGQKKESYFDVLGSNDKENWEPVLTKSRSCDFSGDMQVFEFPPSKSEKEYRYIKLVGQGNSLDNWNVISEFRIFGFRHKNPTSYEDLIVKIYPNPAIEMVNILIDEPAFNPDFIKIVSLTGKVLYSDKIDPVIRQFQVILGFRPGVYIVQMGTSELTIFTQKLIIIK